MLVMTAVLMPLCPTCGRTMLKARGHTMILGRRSTISPPMSTCPAPGARPMSLGGTSRLCHLQASSFRNLCQKRSKGAGSGPRLACHDLLIRLKLRLTAPSRLMCEPSERPAWIPIMLLPLGGRTRGDLIGKIRIAAPGGAIALDVPGAHRTKPYRQATAKGRGQAPGLITRRTPRQVCLLEPRLRFAPRVRVCLTRSLSPYLQIPRPRKWGNSASLTSGLSLRVFASAPTVLSLGIYVPSSLDILIQAARAEQRTPGMSIRWELQKKAVIYRPLPP